MGDGPRTTTRLELVEEVVVGDGGGEAAIKNHRHRLPHHLHKAYAALVTSPFQDHDPCLPGRLLREFSSPEFYMYQLHQHLPFCLNPTLLPFLYIVLGSYLPPP